MEFALMHCRAQLVLREERIAHVVDMHAQRKEMEIKNDECLDPHSPHTCEELL
jgi:hypothetical protein